MKSVYDQLDKIRKPRVQISYELEDGGQTVKKELPFVVGVMGDYSADSEQSKVPFKDRKFVQIDGENFNQVMERLQPKLNIKVANKLSDKDEEMAVELNFSNMDDFNPDNLVKQIPALKSLLDARNQLRELVSKAERSDKLEALLEQILQSNDDLKTIVDALPAEETTEEKTEEASQ